ncbi:MAG: diaminopimelate epimerase [Limnochordales bacterium]|nr:diaminopimelate epimerase [Limnochordales bacterium]
MEFTKMHGLGNDYIFINLLDNPDQEEQIDWQALSRLASNRYTGVGSDGIILICRPAADGHFRMRIFNADGSEGEMCGNGIRCVGRFVYDHGYTRERDLTVETRAGLRRLHLLIDERGHASQVIVDMGKPAPMAVPPESAVPLRGLPGGFYVYALGGPQSEPSLDGEVAGIPVSMGNPHLVIFVPATQNVPLASIGPVLEHHPAFPNRTNVEFVEVLPDQQLRVRVWERGSGETQACGTGACASAVAAMVSGWIDAPAGIEKNVTVYLPGGPLKIRWRGPGETLFMEGPAEEVYSGRFSSSFLARAKCYRD